MLIAREQELDELYAVLCVPFLPAGGQWAAPAEQDHPTGSLGQDKPTSLSVLG